MDTPKLDTLAREVEREFARSRFEIGSDGYADFQDIQECAKSVLKNRSTREITLLLSEATNAGNKDLTNLLEEDVMHEGDFPYGELADKIKEQKSFSMRDMMVLMLVSLVSRWLFRSANVMDLLEEATPTCAVPECSNVAEYMGAVRYDDGLEWKPLCERHMQHFQDTDPDLPKPFQLKEHYEK